MKRFYIFTLLLLGLFINGCNSIKPPLTEEQSRSETRKAVEVIKGNPDWLDSIEICPAEVVPNYEKEIAYLGDGCKDDPLGCLEKCRKEDGNACYSLALLIQDYEGMNQTFSESLFLRSCKYGITSGCTNRAAYKLGNEKDNPAAVKCATDTFEKTCAKNDPWGCTMYANSLVYSIGREQNLDEALKALSKSCAYGEDDPACQQAKELREKILKAKKEAATKDVNSNTAKK
jgi:TPR repeat protein